MVYSYLVLHDFHFWKWNKHWLISKYLGLIDSLNIVRKCVIHIWKTWEYSWWMSLILAKLKGCLDLQFCNCQEINFQLHQSIVMLLISEADSKWNWCIWLMLLAYTDEKNLACSLAIWSLGYPAELFIWLARYSWSHDHQYFSWNKKKCCIAHYRSPTRKWVVVL